MRILHTVAGLREGTGGPVASVTTLCAGLAAKGHQVTLLTGSGSLHPAVEALQPTVRVRTEPLGPYLLANWSSAFRTACLDEARQTDIVHDHGVWLHTNWSSSRMAGRAGRPIVRSPRGMLSPWALSRSRFVKRVLWTVVERRLFEKAALIHATSQQEERDVRRLGTRVPTVVIPNGIDLDGEFATPRIADARARGIPEAQGRRAVLFLSRVHPVKGLDLLCRAWATLPDDSPVVLLVAGTGEDAAIARLRHWLTEQPGPPARYVGPVTGERKLALLSSAWLLVLPSRSENYGMVVAEALASGTPVLTTTAMPWASVTRASCGWVVPPDAVPLARALGEALRLTASEHEGMRDRARHLVARDHSLGSTIAHMEDSYRALLSPRSRD